MRDAAKAVSQILLELKEDAKPGVNLLQIEEHAAKLLKKYHVKSFNKGYKPKWAPEPYPAITCLNVNSVIAHGIPIDLTLESGDLLSIDLGIINNDGYCGDAALTVGVGELGNKESRLLYYANKIVYEAIKYLIPGQNTEDIARAIERFAKTRGYLVNRRFGGHRIETKMHLSPKIYNSVEPEHKYAKIEAGQIFCIEPMITPGKDALGGVFPNGWTYATQDAEPSVFFEHMVLVTDNGPEVLTTHFREENI